jgi:PAS domain S-box-containing protein
VDNYIVVAHQIYYSGIHYGSVLIFFEYNKFDIWKNQLSISIFFILGIVLIISIILSISLHRFITKPITDLTNIALKVMQTGDFTIRASENRIDEAGILNRTFNAMLRTIAGYYAEREEVEQSLRDNEMRYRALFDYSPIPVFLFESEKCTMLNFTAMQLFKIIERNDVIGSHYKEIFKTDSEEHYDYIFNNRTVNERRVSFDFVIFDKFSNRKYIELTSMMVHTNGVVSLIIMCMDISEKIHFESELLKMNQELENRVKQRTNELETTMRQLNHKNQLMNLKEIELNEAKNEAERANRIKSEFIANISHEIRTPMNVIKGYSEMLFKRITEPESIKILKSIVYSSETLLSIINDILDLSKIEAGKLHISPHEVDLVKTFFEIQDMFSSRSQDKNLTLTFDFPQNLPSQVMIDGTRLNQILFNLISNSIKFTEQGYIKVHCNYEMQTKESMKLTLTVEDTGIGIKAENIEYIFDAFAQERWQSKASQLGTGLGLTITKRLVESMNGMITVVSEENVGTAFTVVFNEVPVLPNGNTIKFLKEGHKPKYHCEHTCKSLIIDDYELNRLVLRDKLEEFGIQIYEAHDLKSSLEAIEKNEFQIIFIDLVIPEHDGNEIAKQIRKSKHFNNCPLIVYTASLTFSLDDNSNFDDLLTKPVKNSIFYDLINKYLGSSLEQAPEEIEHVQFDDDEDTDIDDKKLSELIDLINTNWAVTAFEMSQSQIIDDIQSFIFTLKSKVDYFSIQIFEQYTLRLERAAEEFEISRVKNILNDISSLRNELVNIRNLRKVK